MSVSLQFRGYPPYQRVVTISDALFLKLCSLEVQKPFRHVILVGTFYSPVHIMLFTWFAFILFPSVWKLMWPQSSQSRCCCMAWIGVRGHTELLHHQDEVGVKLTPTEGKSSGNGQVRLGFPLSSSGRTRTVFPEK